MIQRVQSLFLAMTDLVLVALLFVPFGYTRFPEQSAESDVAVTILYNVPALIGAIVICSLAMMTLAMFRNRELQMKLCIAGIVLSAAYSTFLCLNSFSPPENAVWTIGPGVYVSLVNILLFLLARYFVKKDDDMVKSMDRIR